MLNVDTLKRKVFTYNGLPENLRYYASNFVSSPARPFSRISRYLKVQKHDMFTKLDYKSYLLQICESVNMITTLGLSLQLVCILELHDDTPGLKLSDDSLMVLMFWFVNSKNTTCFNTHILLFGVCLQYSIT